MAVGKSHGLSEPLPSPLSSGLILVSSEADTGVQETLSCESIQSVGRWNRVHTQQDGVPFVLQGHCQFPRDGYRVQFGHKRRKKHEVSLEIYLISFLFLTLHPSWSCDYPVGP